MSKKRVWIYLSRSVGWVDCQLAVSTLLLLMFCCAAVAVGEVAVWVTWTMVFLLAGVTAVLLLLGRLVLMLAGYSSAAIFFFKDKVTIS